VDLQQAPPDAGPDTGLTPPPRNLPDCRQDEKEAQNCEIGASQPMRLILAVIVNNRRSEIVRAKDNVSAYGGA
jgi:hypothetical protein